MTPKSHFSLRLPVSALSVCAVLLLQGCSGGRAAPSSPPSDSEISTYLQTRAQTLHPALPGLRLTDFRFSSDRRIVCGVLRAPGQPPQVFASVDATPMTLERPIGLPYVAGSATSEADRLARQRALNDDICARNGLLPEAGT